MANMSRHGQNPVTSMLSRRQLLTRCGMGMGALALGTLMSETGYGSMGGISGTSPLRPQGLEFRGKGKRVINRFMNGGPSQVDTFDPKPSLARYAGKMLPIPNYKTERKTGAAFPSPYKFEKYGKSGIEVSEIFKHTAQCVDDMCVIRSMQADVPNHEPSLLLMNCGEARLIRPSMGSWITYGLGTDNQNLPGFVVLCPGGYPIQESQNWQAGVFSRVLHGTYIST